MTRRSTMKRQPTAKKNAGAAMHKAWAGRFAEPTDRLVEAFTSSLAVDRRLYPYDIDGSLAHCQALAAAGVLTRAEAKTLADGLARVRAELDADRFPFQPSDEDIHMAIERRLTELVGPVGGKLHTGRSRNDQVATDVRLYVREQLGLLQRALADVQRAGVRQARKNIDVVMPGYTHLQRAQPISVAHHFLAYVEMLERDKQRLVDARVRVNVSPLGSGALAGSNYPIDRWIAARALEFSALTQNSLDAVSDRDFLVEVLAALSLVMMHLSRLCEELILWMSQEFRFVTLPDRFCTGSSMMPQKKNPDVPELIRGKAARVYGHLTGALTLLKGLPLSYNRDLQEDKAALFDAVDTVQSSLGVLAPLIEGLTVNRDVVAQAAESGGLLATELADYLVMKGIPFRETHGIVGKIVRACLAQGRELQSLSLDELRTFSKAFAADVRDRLSVLAAVDRKHQIGGTARRMVTKQVAAWERRLG
ncbi:MAG: argininosuccinate lyase [Nitrospiraceae bacterium]